MSIVSFNTVKCNGSQLVKSHLLFHFWVLTTFPFIFEQSAMEADAELVETDGDQKTACLCMCHASYDAA